MPNYKGLLSSKLPETKTSIFAVMSKLANDYGAVNLSQGFPDFRVDKRLIDRVAHYMNLGKNQYAPMQGVPGLLKSISAKAKLNYGVEYDWHDEINITAGATQALNTVISAFINEGDEAIIFEPAYDSYSPSVRACGGIVREVTLKAPHFSIDWDRVSEIVNERTRIIIINSPHNPTGTLIGDEDMKKLDKLTENSNIIVLSDEVYEHLIFDGKKHHSACMYPGLRDRSFVVGSFGKTFHATGWKMGFVLAPANLMAEFRKLHQFVVFTCNTPIQYALADFLTDPSNYRELGSFYQEKRDYFIEGIQGSRFDVIDSHGTYFQLLNYTRISDLPEMDFAMEMVRQYGIAAIPVSAFYHDSLNQNLLRFCFAKTEDTLDRAIEILKKV
jgi:methionine aminotransferase